MSARSAKRRHGASRRRFNLPEAVAARIRELRVALDWSQERMAAEAGLSKDAVSRIERGDRDPRLVTLAQIGTAMGCSLPELLDFEKVLPQMTWAQDGPTRTILRLVDQLDPRLVEVVITLLRGLVRLEYKRRARMTW
jgi:transcriptional regulator with XRE-family HTH domain